MPRRGSPESESVVAFETKSRSLCAITPLEPRVSARATSVGGASLSAVVLLAPPSSQLSPEASAE